MSIPDLKLISDYVDHYAEVTPDREAMVLDDRRWSYRQLSQDVDTCARALIAAGVTKGDRVATLSAPNPDFLILFLATSSIGAIWVGLNPRYQLDELDYIITDAEPCHLFAPMKIGDRNYEKEFITLAREHVCIHRLIVMGAASPGDHSLQDRCKGYDDFIADGRSISDKELTAVRQSVTPDDPALIVYTSGTTGKPKGALLPHRGLVKCARVQLRYLPVDPVRILNYLPVNHIGCVGDICCYALAGGGTIIFMEQFEPARSMELVQNEGITLWGGVPSALQMCMSLPDFSGYDLSSVQLIAWGGAAATASLIAQFLDVCPRLACSYGLTESVGSIAFVTPYADIEVLANTVGNPVSEYDVRIADPEGSALDTGKAGEIQVRGDFIMLGYWNAPDKTRETITADGWLHTGDLGVLREDGNLQLVGRLKEMFKSGGYNVYPREIEQVIEQMPQVAMAAVIGIPDPLYQEVGWAYILPQTGSVLTGDEVEQHCRAHLANYKVPKGFVISPELPLLPIGKIDKKTLKEHSKT